MNGVTNENGRRRAYQSDKRMVPSHANSSMRRSALCHGISDTHPPVILSPGGRSIPPAKPVRISGNAANQDVRGYEQALRAGVLRIFDPQHDGAGDVTSAVMGR